MGLGPRTSPEGGRAGGEAIDGRASRRRCSSSTRRGVPTFDYGNNIRQMAKDEGVANAFAFPGFVPAYIRPLFCRGIGPFRWVALSGDPEDIYRTDEKVKDLLPGDKHLHHWLDLARARRSSFRVCPPGSAGSAWATATGWDSPLTRWSPAASCKRPS